MTVLQYAYWLKRGEQDAVLGRAPIFKMNGECAWAVGEWFEDNDTDENEAGAAYLEGFNK